MSAVAVRMRRLGVIDFLEGLFVLFRVFSWIHLSGDQEDDPRNHTKRHEQKHEIRTTRRMRCHITPWSRNSHAWSGPRAQDGPATVMSRCARRRREPDSRGDNRCCKPYLSRESLRRRPCSGLAGLRRDTWCCRFPPPAWTVGHGPWSRRPAECCVDLPLSQCRGKPASRSCRVFAHSRAIDRSEE